MLNIYHKKCMNFIYNFQKITINIKKLSINSLKPMIKRSHTQKVHKRIIKMKNLNLIILQTNFQETNTYRKINILKIINLSLKPCYKF
jgi:hypothetical protein